MEKHLLTVTLSILFAANISAADIRVAKGSFVWNVGVAGFYNTSIDLDIDILSLNKQHYNIKKSNFYLFGNLDIYSSQKVDQMTDIIDNTMMQELPSNPLESIFNIDASTPNEILGNFIPVPSSYEISGLDFNIGVGYDLFKSPKGYLGVGVMTGISTPYMDMENPIEAIEFIDNFLTKTHTDIKTYKAGVTLQAGYNATESLSLYTTITYAQQTGSIENSIIKSSMDIDGGYRALDLGLKLYSDSDYLPENLYATLGYSAKRWSVDSIKGEIIGFTSPNIASHFTNDLSTDYLYFGIGYQF